MTGQYPMTTNKYKKGLEDIQRALETYESKHTHKEKEVKTNVETLKEGQRLNEFDETDELV